jgi:hypothetical protein
MTSFSGADDEEEQQAIIKAAPLRLTRYPPGSGYNYGRKTEKMRRRLHDTQRDNEQEHEHD